MDAASERVHVLGCPIDAVTMEQALARVEDAIQQSQRLQHVSINAAKLVKFQRDPALREAVTGCHLITADGQAIVWAARILGLPLPERVAGIDLLDALLRIAPERGYRVFLLGARPTVLERAEKAIIERYPGVVVAGRHHGYFTREEEPSVVEQIHEARPHLLFIALETPAKELFLARHRSRLSVPYAMGVGGAFDILAGVRHRAPRWLRQLGLEWLFRLAQDPRRLAGRYVVGNTKFTWLVIREAARRRLAA
jgi:N-acetylglucosaminyldiphosphoundecaprenol N-acetyl-beta-D-mannosaminyltransferase